MPREWTKAQRDPRVNPRAGDALLCDGQALVVGDIPGTEVMFGYGDHRYYYKPIAEWREWMKGARVLHTWRKGRD